MPHLGTESKFHRAAKGTYNNLTSSASLLVRGELSLAHSFVSERTVEMACTYWASISVLHRTVFNGHSLASPFTLKAARSASTTNSAIIVRAYGYSSTEPETIIPVRICIKIDIIILRSSDRYLVLSLPVLKLNVCLRRPITSFTCPAPTRPSFLFNSVNS